MQIKPNMITQQPMLQKTYETKGEVQSQDVTTQEQPVVKSSVDSVIAKFMPLSFKGNAPLIKNAVVLNKHGEDIPLERTKNGGYIVESKTRTELIYGNDAAKFLKDRKEFDRNTQVTFPKHASGKLIYDGKVIKLSENSSVILNAGAKAQIIVDKGFPQILASEKDYDWYGDYEQYPKDDRLKGKFDEVMRQNSHIYNGEMKDTQFSKDKAYNEYLANKLFDSGLAESRGNGYIKFKTFPFWSFKEKQLEKAGFTKDELEKIRPAYEQARQVRGEARMTRTTEKNGMSEELIDKLKETDVLYNTNPKASKIYWKDNYESKDHLRWILGEKGFNEEEKDIVSQAWYKNNKIGYDLSGLKFLSNDVAVYKLEDKINAWNLEKSCWLTNSTAVSGSGKPSPSMGTSIVQSDITEPVPMSKVRNGECLHTHPGRDDKSQTELYLITSGCAALNVVRNGKPEVKILREGDLAVIPPDTAHCVNSVMGEYEQVVSQIPSAFHYGLAFKQHYDMPEGYTEDGLVQEAYEKLSAEKNK